MIRTRATGRTRLARRSSRRAAQRYLAGAAVGAWFTKQALSPVALPKLRAIPSFFAGWLTNELAFHHLVWQSAASAGFIRRGALRHWQGRVAAGLTLAQWVGLGMVIRSSFATKDALERALAEGLGAQNELDTEQETTPRSLRWGQLVAPLPMRARGVERTRGVRFGRAGGRDLHLDVYRSVDHPGSRRPVILYIHGGAWIISNRNEQGLPLMHEMAARGWIGVNADYRLSPSATFPDHLTDVRRAIAWIREHADEIGADPDFIAIAGGSAGGHLCALAALTHDEPAFRGDRDGLDTSVQACVPFYGIYDFGDRDGIHHDRFADFIARFVMKSTPEDDPEAYRLASPVQHVRADAPPFFIIHPELDTLAPREGARAFAASLRAVSRAPVLYAELPGAQHAFDVFPSLRTSYTLHAVARFLQHVYDRSRGDGRAQALQEPPASFSSGPDELVRGGRT